MNSKMFTYSKYASGELKRCSRIQKSSCIQEIFADSKNVHVFKKNSKLKNYSHIRKVFTYSKTFHELENVHEFDKVREFEIGSWRIENMFTF